MLERSTDLIEQAAAHRTFTDMGGAAALEPEDLEPWTRRHPSSTRPTCTSTPPLVPVILRAWRAAARVTPSHVRRAGCS